MKANKWYLIGFVVMILLQWLLPGRMIIQSERDLQKGTMYKFLVAPVDPNDPFRGKYLTLNYRENSIRGELLEAYGAGSIVYVAIREDEKGFADAFRVASEKPKDTSEFVEARVTRINPEDDYSVITVEYPFNRYFVNEKRAPEIEKSFLKASGESDLDTYAVVRVRNGRGLLEDIVINGVSVHK